MEKYYQANNHYPTQNDFYKIINSSHSFQYFSSTASNKTYALYYPTFGRRDFAIGNAQSDLFYLGRYLVTSCDTQNRCSPSEIPKSSQLIEQPAKFLLSGSYKNYNNFILGFDGSGDKLHSYKFSDLEYDSNYFAKVTRADKNGLKYEALKATGKIGITKVIFQKMSCVGSNPPRCGSPETIEAVFDIVELIL